MQHPTELVEWARHWLPRRRVRLLDTVLLDRARNPEAWFYTSSKSGEVCLKDRTHLTWPKIGRRFTKFAQRCGTSATLFRDDGSRIPVSDAHWERLVHADARDRQSMLHGVIALQAFVAPRDSQVWCRATHDTIIDVGGASPLEPSIAARLQETTLALARDNQGSCVDAIFVADKGGELWLVEARCVPLADAATATPRKQLRRRTELRPLSDPPKQRFFRGDASLPRSAGPLPSLPTPWETERQDERRSNVGKLAHHKRIVSEDQPESHSPEHDESRLKAALLQAAAAEERANTSVREANDAKRELSCAEAHFQQEMEEKARELERARLEVDAVKARAAASGLSRCSSRSASATVAALLDQLEEREQALEQAERARSQERIDMEAARSVAVREAARAAEARSDEIQRLLEEEQDKSSNLESELEAARAKCKASSRLADELLVELEAARKEMRDREDAHLAATQSIRISASLEKAVATMSPEEERPSTTVSEQQHSTTEAKLRQLHNKVVFLKSSLTMEMEAKQEVEKRLVEAQASLLTERAEHEKRVEEANEAREIALRASEERAAAALEEAQARTMHLETKLASAQAAYTDSLRDAGVAKRREEAAKAEVQRERAAREAAERVAQRDRQALLAARTCSSSEGTREDTTTEVVRRLENEQQYLRAQLTSEALCKGELEAALAKAREEIDEAKHQGEEATSKAFESARTLAERAEKAERLVRSLESQKTASEAAFGKQLESVKAAYVKTRDNLRVEQAEHARTRRARGELISTASQMRSEKERIERAFAEARERASGDMRAARQAFEEAEATATEAADAARAELSTSLQRLDEARMREFEAERRVKTAHTLASRAGQLGVVAFLTSGEKRLRTSGRRSLEIWKQAALEARWRDERREALAEAERHSAARAKRDVEFAVNAAMQKHAEDLGAAVVAERAVVSVEAARSEAHALAMHHDRFDAARAVADAKLHREQQLRRDLCSELEKVKEQRLAMAARSDRLEGELGEAERQADLMSKTERRLRARRACVAADALVVRVALITEFCDDASAHVRELGGQFWEASSDENSSVEQEKHACRITREALASVFEAECCTTPAYTPHDKCAQLIEAAEAAVASATASIAATERSRFQASARAIRDAADEAIRKSSRQGYEERKELDADLTEAVRQMDNCRAELVVSRDARRAAEATSRALHAQSEHARSECDELRGALGKLSCAAADFAATETKRFEAALAAGVALRSSVAAEHTRSERSKIDALLAASAAAEARVAEAIESERERWRSSLRDADLRADERHAAAWRAGMEERDRVAKREAADLRAAAERAVAEVRASAAASLEAVRNDTKRAVDRAAERAIEREAQAVKQATEATLDACRRAQTDAVAANSAAADAKTRLAVAQILATEAAKRDDQEQKHERREAESKRECEELRQNLQELEKCAASEQIRLEDARLECFLAVDRAQEEAERNVVREADRVAAQRDSTEAARVAATAAEVTRVFKNAMAAAELREQVSLSTERDQAKRHLSELVGPLEQRLDAYQAELVSLRAVSADTAMSLVRANEDTVELVARLGRETRQAALDKFKLVARGVATLAQARKEHSIQLENCGAELHALREHSTRNERNAASVRTQLEAQLAQCDAWRVRMHETLVNHERATLLAHKKRSTELGAQLDAIVTQRDEAETERDRLVDAIESMQHSVQSIEDAIRDHNKSSSIEPDGRINIAHAKKKKRLDDDHDKLLSGLERQRAAISQVDATIAKFNDDREAKEDEIKALERRLVELLVTQQKKLLAILQEAAKQNRTIVDDHSPRQRDTAGAS